MSGYVRLHRSLIGHPAFRNDAEAMAFAWLVAKAAWKPARVRYKARAISLTRGQVAISVRDFAAAMDRDKAWVERLLKRLRAETMVETRHETGINVITICNYGQYQTNSSAGETLDETLQETPARQAQDTEQGREEREEVSSEAKASSPRGRFPAPPDVSDEQWAAFRAQRKKPLNARAYKLICNKLLSLAEHGWPPGDMIDLAIERGWETVFEPRQEHRNGQSASNISSLRGARPDPALDLLRSASAAEDREDSWGARTPVPAFRPS